MLNSRLGSLVVAASELRLDGTAEEVEASVKVAALVEVGADFAAVFESDVCLEQGEILSTS